MKTFITSLLLASFWLAAPLKAGIIYTFGDQSTFDSQFPTKILSGDLSTASLLSNPSRVQLLAQQDNTAQSKTWAAIYSESSSEFDFIDSSKTFTFTNVALSYSGTGLTYAGHLGVFAKGRGSVDGTLSTNPGTGVYIFLDRYNNHVEVRQLSGGGFATLAAWSVINGYSFSSISLTLDATSWSLVAVDSHGNQYTNATAASGDYIGVFKTALTNASWGPNFYLGMEAEVSTATANRFANLTVGQVAVVPEARTSMLMLMGIAALAFSKPCRSLVKWRGSR